MKSWQTTAAGVATIIAIASGAIRLLADGNPETNPDWNTVIGGLTAGIIGLCARDNKVSSEAVGAKTD
jgi:hypothetical protein